MVRPAVEADRWRIAEILVFAKRMAYRPIFQDDFYSFHLLNVHDTAQEVDPSAALCGKRMASSKESSPSVRHGIWTAWTAVKYMSFT